MKRIFCVFLVMSFVFSSVAVPVFAGSSTPPSYEQRVNKTKENSEDKEVVDTTDDDGDYEEKTSRPVVDTGKYEVINKQERPERPTVELPADEETTNTKPTRPVVDTTTDDNDDTETNISQTSSRPTVDTTDDNSMDIEVHTIEQRPLSNQVIIENNNDTELPNDKQIKIYFNNQKLDTKESSPIVISDRILVPVRFILEKMGYDVDFDNVSKVVIATDSVGNMLKMGINNEFVKINSLYYYVDVPAKIIGERTMVPVRFVSEKLGAEVVWDEKTNSVYITYNNDTITKLYNSTIYVAERDYKLYAIPAYSYSNGYYAEATMAVRSVNGFNKHRNNSTLEGTLEVWNNKYAVHTLKIPYDMTKKNDHYRQTADVYSGDDVVGNIYITKNGSSVYVKLSDISTYSEIPMTRHSVNEYMLKKNTIPSNNTKNEIIDIKRYEIDRPSVEQIRFKIVWKSKYQTDNFNIEVKSNDSADELYITHSAPESNYNEYSSIIHVNFRGKKLKDVKLNITVFADGISKKYEDYYSTQARLLSLFKDDIKKQEEQLTNNINELWRLTSIKLYEQQENLYNKVFDNSYIIMPDGQTDEVKAVKMFFGKKYYDYLCKNNGFNNSSIDEMDIIKNVYGNIVNGAIDINKTETIMYKGKQYTILVQGWNYGGAGTYTVIVNNSSRYTINSDMLAIKSEMYKYQNELKGMYDTAVQECINNTVEVVAGEILGLKNLKKIAAAWIDEKFWGSDLKNEFIDIALKGITTETKLTELCDTLEDAVEAVSSAKNNTNVEKCNSALEKVENIGILFNSWKELLQ